MSCGYCSIFWTISLCLGHGLLGFLRESRLILFTFRFSKFYINLLSLQLSFGYFFHRVSSSTTATK